MLAWLTSSPRNRAATEASRRDRIRKLEKLRIDACAERLLEERGYAAGDPLTEFQGRREADISSHV